MGAFPMMVWPSRRRFTGDHDVSIFDAGFQSGFFQDDLDAGLEDGICVGKESETESTGGSGARVVRVGIRVFFTGDVGVGGKPLIHLADHVRSGSFLRPKMALQPWGPQSGLVTSQAILK